MDGARDEAKLAYMPDSSVAHQGNGEGPSNARKKLKLPELTEDEHTLWLTKDVEEVRDVEQRTWRAAEDKKEELRQLVGLRYRDLLDSADAIMDMKTLSAQAVDVWAEVLSNLAAVEHLTEQNDMSVLHGKEPSSIAESKREAKNDPADEMRFTRCRHAIKLLSDGSEGVWDRLESQDYVGACALWFRLRHTYQRLCQERSRESLFKQLSSARKDRLRSALILMDQEWSSLSSFPPLICSHAQRALRTRDLSVTLYRSSLVCMTLMSSLQRQHSKHETDSHQQQWNHMEAGSTVPSNKAIDVGCVDSHVAALDLFLSSRTESAVSLLQTAIESLRKQRGTGRAASPRAGSPRALLASSLSQSMPSGGAALEMPMVIQDKSGLFSAVHFHWPTRIVAHALAMAARLLVQTVLHCAVLFFPLDVKASDLEDASRMARLHRAGAAGGNDAQRHPDKIPLQGQEMQSQTVKNAAQQFLRAHQKNFELLPPELRPGGPDGAALDDLSVHELRTHAQLWLDTYKTKVEPYMEELLACVHRGEYLSAVRNAVLSELVNSIASWHLDKMTESESVNRQSGDRASSAPTVCLPWQQACPLMFGQLIHPWPSVFSPIFHKQEQRIVTLSFGALPLDLNRMLDAALESIMLQSQSASTDAASGGIKSPLVTTFSPQPKGTLGLSLSAGVSPILSPTGRRDAPRFSRARSAVRTKLRFNGEEDEDDDADGDGITVALQPFSTKGNEVERKRGDESDDEAEDRVARDAAGAPDEDEDGMLSGQVLEICERFEEQLSVLIQDLRFLLHCPSLNLGDDSAPDTSKARRSARDADTSTGTVRERKQQAKLMEEQEATRRAKMHAERVRAYEVAADCAGLAAAHRHVVEGVSPFIQRSATEAVSSLVAGLQDRLTKVQTTTFQMWSPLEALKHVDQAVFVGRVCAQLLENSVASETSRHDAPQTYVQAKAPFPTPSNNPPLLVPLPLPPPSGTLRDILLLKEGLSARDGGKNIDSSQSESATLSYAQRSLQSTAHFGFRIWTRFVASKLGDGFRVDVDSWMQACALPSETTVSSTVSSKSKLSLHNRVALGDAFWRTIPDHSDLSIPCYASAYITRALFLLGQELYRVNGSTLNMYVIRSLVADVADAVLTILEDVWLSHSESPQRIDEEQDRPVSKASGGTVAATASRRLACLHPRACTQALLDVQLLFAVLDIKALRAEAQPITDSHAKNIAGLATPLETASGSVRRLDALLEVLRSRLDPVDRITLEPHLLAQVEVLFNSTAVMFGPLGRLHRQRQRLSVESKSGGATGMAKSSVAGVGGSRVEESSGVVMVGRQVATLPLFPVELYPTSVADTMQ